MTLTRAKITTTIWDKFAPRPLPNLVRIHSAPVITFDRRSQGERYTIRKIWLKTGQTHGIHILFIPYRESQYTRSMVPAISNMPEAFDTPRKYQGRLLPPRKYELMFLEALLDTQYPIIMVDTR
jgi:hypothetical protein